MLSRLSRLRPDWIAAAVVLIVAALQIDPLPVGVMRDDAMYVVLAKSLATGHGYRWINLPGAPVATHFPPGYPALLALIWWLVPAFPANVFAFKALNALLTAVVTLGTARLAMTRFAMSRWAAAVVGIAAGLSVPMISLGIRVMSEPLFLAMAIATLFVAERVVDGDDRWQAAALAGALAGTATLVRSFGIALVGAVVLALLLRRRVRAAAIALASSMVFVLPWQLFVSAHQGVVPQPMRGNYESYTAWFTAALREGGPPLLARTMANNARGVGNVLAGTFGWAVPHRVWALVLVVTLVLLIAGSRVLWTHARVTALFLGAYSAILLAWPYFGARYIWGAWPLVILTVALGVREVYTRRPSGSLLLVGHRCARAVLAAGMLMYAVGAWQAAHEHVWSVVASAQATPIRNVVRWINDRTPAEAIVAANYEGSVYLYTDRLTVPVNSLRPETVRPRTTEESAQALGEIVHAYHVTTVALTVPWLVDAANALSARTPPALVPLERFDGGEAFTPTADVR